MALRAVPLFNSQNTSPHYYSLHLAPEETRALSVGRDPARLRNGGVGNQNQIVRTYCARVRSFNFRMNDTFTCLINLKSVKRYKMKGLIPTSLPTCLHEPPVTSNHFYQLQGCPSRVLMQQNCILYFVWFYFVFLKNQTSVWGTFQAHSKTEWLVTDKYLQNE